MNKLRLYLLVDDEKKAQKITDIARSNGLEDEDIAAVAKRTKYPLEGDVPEAGIAERSDLLGAAKKGATLGGSIGLFAGLAASVVNPLGIIVAGGAVAATTLLGAAAGTWTSTLVGVSVPNPELDKFQEAIDEGNILILIDASEEKASTLQKEIKNHYPNLSIHAEEEAESA